MKTDNATSETPMKPGTTTTTSKIHVTDDTPPGLATPCWKWMGAHDASGYARMKVDGRCVYVRREMIKCSGVELDQDAKVISLCRDRGCINPDHHLTGTDYEARLFGRWGRLGVGDLWHAKRLVESGEVTTSWVAYAWQVSEPIVVNGIARCA